MSLFEMPHRSTAHVVGMYQRSRGSVTPAAGGPRVSPTAPLGTRTQDSHSPRDPRSPFRNPE